MSAFRPLSAALSALLLFPAAAFAAPAAATTTADPLADGLTAYVRDARAVAAALEADAEPRSQAAALASLAEQAHALVEPFARRRPACADYLHAAGALRERWTSLSVADIERDYHRDEALPAIADPSMRAVCYQMKDLIVHPLTALRLLREDTPDVAAIRHEVVEVVAHGQALAALAGVPAG